MSPFKFKFTAHPQHDAEGFTVMDAQCRGCTPDEMCPRSGHCERYMSPLRDVYSIAAHMIHSLPWCDACQSYHSAAAPGCFITRHEELHRVFGKSPVLAAPYGNPKGWQEVDGVKLPPVDTWAADDEISHSSVEEKKAVAEHFLNGPWVTPRSFIAAARTFKRPNHLMTTEELYAELMEPKPTIDNIAEEPVPVKLSEMTDEELNEVHSHWLRNGRSE